MSEERNRMVGHIARMLLLSKSEPVDLGTLDNCVLSLTDEDVSALERADFTTQYIVNRRRRLSPATYH